MVNTARHYRWDQSGQVCHHFVWLVEQLPVWTDEHSEIPMEVFTALKSIPNELSFVAMWALGCYKEFLNTKPEQLPEVLAFVYGYLGYEMERFFC